MIQRGDVANVYDDEQWGFSPDKEEKKPEQIDDQDAVASGSDDRPEDADA